MKEAYTWENNWNLVNLAGMSVKRGMSVAKERLKVLESIGAKPPERITGDEDKGAINFEWPDEGIRLWAHEDGRWELRKDGGVLRDFLGSEPRC